jgi:hypothetical protein
MAGSSTVVGTLGDHTNSSLLELAAELDQAGSPLARIVRRIVEGGGSAEPAVARFNNSMDPPPAR